jgi:hypothetical protein
MVGWPVVSGLALRENVMVQGVAEGGCSRPGSPKGPLPPARPRLLTVDEMGQCPRDPITFQ